MITFTEEILNGKLHFLCSEPNPMVTLVIAMKLECLKYLKNTFNIGCDTFSGKWLNSWNSEIFRFLTGFKKKVFKISVFLVSPVKNIFAFYELNIFNRLSLVRKQRPNCFSKLFIFRNISPVYNEYLLTNYTYKDMLLNVDHKCL